MIKQLKIQNFQCHDRLKVDLDKVTCIVGPTDIGKSSLFRSFRWLATNNPSGEQFIQDGSRGCTAIASVDGHEIRRRKGSGLNEYLLDNKTFKAFGSNVPDPIKNLLKISPLNFQEQHDSPFWFCETAGQVSRNLNAIVDLELIDNCLSAINSELKRAKIEQELVDERVEKAVKKKKDLVWVIDADDDFKEVENLLIIFNTKLNQFDSLETLTIEIQAKKEDIKETKEKLDELEYVLNLGSQREDIKARYNHLTETLNEIKRLRKIKAPDITKLKQYIDAWKELRQEFLLLDDVLTSIEDADQDKTRAETKLSSLESEIKSKTKGICPICQNPMK